MGNTLLKPEQYHTVNFFVCELDNKDLLNHAKYYILNDSKKQIIVDLTNGRIKFSYKLKDDYEIDCVYYNVNGKKSPHPKTVIFGA